MSYTSLLQTKADKITSKIHKLLEQKQSFQKKLISAIIYLVFHNIRQEKLFAN